MKGSSKSIELNKRGIRRLRRFSAHRRCMSTSGDAIQIIDANTLWKSFGEALGLSLDVQGINSRLRTIEQIRLSAAKKVKYVSDAEAIGADWEQTGSDLRTAMRSYNQSENRMRTPS